MIERASRLLDRFTDALTLLVLSFISLIMIGSGLTLAIIGRPEALVPLLVGVAALSRLPKLLWNFYRDLTGNY